MENNEKENKQETSGGNDPKAKIKLTTGEKVLLGTTVAFVFIAGVQTVKASKLRRENYILRGENSNMNRTENGLLKAIKNLCYHLGKSKQTEIYEQ